MPCNKVGAQLVGTDGLAPKMWRTGLLTKPVDLRRSREETVSFVGIRSAFGPSIL